MTTQNFEVTKAIEGRQEIVDKLSLSGDREQQG